jgi:hypothetical protein
MKLKVALFLAATALPLSASITLSTQFGQAFANNGTPVADGTLWALVVDTNTDNQFTGFGLNAGLYKDLADSTNVASSFFTIGQKLSIGGTLAGNTIFAMGGFNGTASGLAGLLTGVVSADYGTNGLAAGRNYAFYWFPGALYNAAPGAEQVINGEVGGIHTGSNDGIFDNGMVLPPDGALISTGAATAGDAGGSLPNSRFTAVLIPEPSVALLGALGVFGLLRRRRS